MSSIDFTSILFIAVGLSADCFAVAVGGGASMKTVKNIQVARASFTFGFFQAMMPLLGWLAGQTVISLISDYDHWVAFSLLVLVGGRMIWESFRSKRGNSHSNTDFTKGLLLLTLAVATSIDALAVGLSFAFFRVNILLACSTIGSVAFIVTAVGFLIGRKVGKLVGRHAEFIGGIVLIGIGIRILLGHIL